jgi:hypothetical protein
MKLVYLGILMLAVMPQGGNMAYEPIAYNHPPCSDDPEFRRAAGHIRCPICERPFSEHEGDEFCNHWDEMFVRAEQEGVTIEREWIVTFATDDPGKPR